MVLHEARHWQERNIERAFRSQIFELVARDLGFQRTIVTLTPVRDQRIKTHRVNNNARQDVCADFAAFFQNDDRQLFTFFLRELHEPDRSGKTSRSTTDDQNIDFH